MKLAEAKKYQNFFKSSPSNINKGRYKSEEPKNALQKLQNIGNIRSTIKSYQIILELCLRLKKKKKKTRAEGIKILTPTQIHEKLLIEIPQVKVRDSSKIHKTNVGT